MRFSSSQARARRRGLYLVGAEPAARPAPVAEAASQAPPASSLALSPRAFALAIGAALALGIVARASFVLATDFPINDGGLFYVMARDVQANGYRLPEFTAYNGGDIPFAYAPLSIYAAAGLADATGISLISVFRFLPLAISIAAMPAFFLFARSVLRDRIALAVAMFTFALIPHTFDWLIMGGGLTRGFGFVFAILALHQAHLLFTTKKALHAAPLGIFAGLSAMSHAETAWWLAWSVGLFLAFEGRHRTGIAGSGVAAVVALIVAAPWWATVIAQHGLSPFMAAANTRAPSQVNPLVSMLPYPVTGEPLFQLVGALSLLGAIVCLASKRALLPAWILMSGLVDQRTFGRNATLAAAMLVGIAVADLLLPLLERQLARTDGDAAGRSDQRAPLRPLTLGVLAFVVAYAFVGAMSAAPRTLQSLTVDERDAMAWAAANTPASSRFVIVTNDNWAIDRTSEWFPAETGRVSVATVQGYEWVESPTFQDRVNAYRDLQLCADKDVACLDAWSARTGRRFDYVYLPKLGPRSLTVRDEFECCAALRAALRANPTYTVAFDNAGATVFARLPQTACVAGLAVPC